MSLASYIANRLLQYAYVKQVLPSLWSHDYYITVTTPSASSQYKISAFTINQDGTVTIILGRVSYVTGTYNKSSIEIRMIFQATGGTAAYSYEFQIPSLSSFTHPQSIVITIRAGGVYPM